MFCKRCRYNLNHLESQTCPECGSAFDSANPKTFRKKVALPKWRRRAGQGLLLLFVFTLIALGVIEWRYQQGLAAAEVVERAGGRVYWPEDEHQRAREFPLLHKRLQHVTKVDLYGARLTTLPPKSSNLAKLETLVLSGNQLTSLPTEIGNLTTLESLHLRDNQLTSLPPEIGNLPNLVELDLEGNPISDVDLEYLKSLKRLYRLNLENTKVTRQGMADLMKALPNCLISNGFSFPAEGVSE